MSMDNELKEVIAKNLPQAAGELLQKRLAQATLSDEMVTTLNERLAARDKLIDHQTKLIDDLKAQLEAHEAIDKREAEVSERERNAEIEALKVQLAAATSNTQFAKDLAMGLVRNVEYRHSVMSNGSTSEPIVRDGCQVGTARTENFNSHTETKSAT